MGAPVLVLVNRRARRLARSGPILEALRAPVPGARVRETSSLAELDAVAAEIAREPPPAVVLAGGDGSYMAGVTAITRALSEVGRTDAPALALAPGGTAATVARNWGFRGGGVLEVGERAAARYAARLVSAVARGEARATPRPTLRVRDAAGERVGFIVGAGLVSRFFEVYEREGAGGYRGAARIVARIFACSFAGRGLAGRVLEPVPCALELDGARAPFERASLVCASVVRDLGLGMKLLYRAGERHDRFHVVATPLGPRALGPQMPLVLAGRPLLGPRVDALGARLSLRFGEGEGAYVLDGELLRADVVEVTAGPVVTILSVD